MNNTHKGHIGENTHKAGMYPEKSDSNIVPEKSANKGTDVPAERMEGRTLVKRNTPMEAAFRTQSRINALFGLERVR